MPVKLGSKLPTESAEARIEIIPLIDIMFFLLASFMLVSLSMVNMKSVKVNLPTATSATPDLAKDFVDISVNKAGAVFLDKKPMANNELVKSLNAAQQSNPKLRVFISGDQEARHGDVMRVLDLVRSAGIEKVAFEIRAPDKGAPAMTRLLQYFNLFGVLALAVLCGFQWQSNRLLNLQYSDQERTRLDLEAKLAEKEKTLKGYAADLDTFREQLTQSDTIVKDNETKLTTLTGQTQQTAAERDQLKASMDKYAEGIAARDEQIKKGNEEIKKLGAERNEAVAKYNELGSKYNDLVKELNEARMKKKK